MMTYHAKCVHPEIITMPLLLVMSQPYGAAVKEDVHQGFKSNSNLLCQLLKIGRIHQLAELFE